MEIQEQQNEEYWRKMEKSQRRGKIMGGLLVVTAGSLYLARELGTVIPEWVFTWKMLLIAIGLVTAVKHKFAHPAWFILVAVGSCFLLGDIYPEMQIRSIIWPSLVILIGLFIIFKPKSKCRPRHHYHGRWNRRYGHHYKGTYDQSSATETSDKEDFLDSFAFMAGVKKNIISKNFKGGEVTNIFGGSELNLMQADFESKASLEITQVFGGTKLIVPANWEIKATELVTVLGNLEDKRPVQPNLGQGPQKTLVLTGTTVLGGIEINSY